MGPSCFPPSGRSPGWEVCRGSPIQCPYLVPSICHPQTPLFSVLPSRTNCTCEDPTEEVWGARLLRGPERLDILIFILKIEKC